MSLRTDEEEMRDREDEARFWASYKGKRGGECGIIALLVLVALLFAAIRIPCPVCGGKRWFIDPRTGKKVECDYCDENGGAEVSR
jgi:hypothetical protein